MRKLRKIVNLLLVMVFMVTVMTPNFAFADSKKATGILYNSYTLEKLDDVSIKNFKLNKNGVSMVLSGMKTVPINAKFDKLSKIDDQEFDLYHAKTKDYEISIAVVGDIVSGKFKKTDLSPSKRLKVNYDEFSFIVSLNTNIDLNDTLLELQKNTEIKSVVESNKAAIIDNSSKIATFSTYTAYVNASSGSNVAEATAYYNYIGASMYNVNKITYICTQTILPTNYSYVSVWNDASDTSPMWMSSVSNKTTTETVSLTVTNSSALIAQTGQAGFIKIYGVPIPWFIDDWDIYYF